MRTANPFELVGLGIYTVPEAARLAGVPSSRIRRWLVGYDFGPEENRRASPPIFEGDIASDESLALSFADLVELRFVDAFRRVGVGWKTLRETHKKARVKLRTKHPFATGRFVTDGRKILLDLSRETRDRALEDILRDQLEFKKIVEPYLRDLEVKRDAVVRWWPLPRSRRVVIDPGRSFGQPIVAERGVPTRILSRAVRAEGSVEKVARWFEVKPAAVRDAVRYEKRLAA